MDAHERAFVIFAKGGTRGAVCFVADHQVEGVQAVIMLGAADHVDGVVGGEHHTHVLGVVALGHLRCEPISLGGRRVAQLVSKHLYGVIFHLALLANVAVGADGEAVERGFAFLRPFGERLRQQRQAGHEEQHAFAFAGQALGNLQTGEGLARAAGHDQLAAFGGLQASRYSVERG